jgi:hypothetical protein
MKTEKPIPVAIQRLIDEVANEPSLNYNRMHNRHNRSFTPRKAPEDEPPKDDPFPPPDDKETVN